MRLEIGSFRVTDVRSGTATALRDGVLSLDRAAPTVREGRPSNVLERENDLIGRRGLPVQGHGTGGKSVDLGKRRLGAPSVQQWTGIHPQSTMQT